SAAKYVATSTMEVYHDARVYDTGMVTVLEVMGRHAGWLTAATALAAYKGQGPDLIYVPELPFNLEQFISDVKRVYEKNGKVIVAVSEGAQYADGRFVADSGVRDAFGHAQLGGVATTLANIAKEQIGCKVRGIEFSLLQRCASHCASLNDVNEAYMAGETAVLKAVEGYTDYCIGFDRQTGANGEYVCAPKLIPLSDIANTERKLPREWINAEGNFVTQEYIDYALPLIQGESCPPIVDGLPRFAKLAKIK
ncbi:MAG: diphosphate--fructose-6-phosphate 1-phosphotransferase, partial [Clostridia bacterium]|nr:diphosphate--fructose-6-phosphate 1-phosphotransferase [Clostridia bacterium]